MSIRPSMYAREKVMELYLAEGSPTRNSALAAGLRLWVDGCDAGRISVITKEMTGMAAAIDQAVATTARRYERSWISPENHARTIEDLSLLIGVLEHVKHHSGAASDFKDVIDAAIIAVRTHSHAPQTEKQVCL